MTPSHQQVLEQAAAKQLTGTLADNHVLFDALIRNGHSLPKTMTCIEAAPICRLILKDQTIDFHLVRQKDRILTLINRSQYADATQLLHFIEPLWNHLNYGYKYAELMLLIDEKRRPS